MSDAEKFVGQPIERKEDARLLTGNALFADHYPVRPGALHAAVLRSPYAHAEILSIDVSAALALPGVSHVLTGADIRAISDPFLMVLKLPLDEWALAGDRVRYAGEAVALVLATDRYVAEDALEHIVVDYNGLETVVDPELAVLKDSVLIHEDAGKNVVSERSFTYGEPDAAFAAAEHRISITIDYPRNSLTPIEGFVVVADYDAESELFDILSNFQGPFTGHPVMARSLRVPESGVRLRTPACSGGSFGVKQAVLPYIVLMAVAARHSGKTVKWVEDRLEHLSAATAAPNRKVRLEAAVESSGKITALNYDQLDDYGAYLRSPMPGPLYRMHGCMTGAYDIPNLTITNRLVLTNKTPAGLMRGFGGPQMYYALERLMQRIAVTLNLEPLDVIKINLISAGSFPYRAAAGALYDSGDYPHAVNTATSEGGLDELLHRREAARAKGRKYGIGFAAVVEPSMSNMGYLSTITPPEIREKRGPQDGAVSMATVNVSAMGSVSVTADTTPQGQGHATVMAQIVADQLGLTPDQIHVNTEFDTHKDPWSIAAGTYSCRFTPGTAVATHLAAKQIRDKLARIASQTLNAPPEDVEFADGKIFARNNPGNSLSFNRVAGSTHWTPGSLPDGMTGGLRETATWAPPELAPPDSGDHINTALAYGFVFDFCGVEIDPDTGQVRIDKYVTMHDSGKRLNPRIVDGQIQGAFAQGLGAALLESFEYDHDGNFLSGTFADYLVPTSTDVPEPMIMHMESPSPFTPLGAKGVGEGNCMTTPVCLANAVCDALDVADINLPLTPSKLSAIIHGEETPRP